MEIRRYTPEMKPVWDRFVRESRNATFLLTRDYMEYHADRFTDCSYMFLDGKGKVETLLPGSLHGDQLRSHGGLTYGGFILGPHSSGAAPANPMTWLEALVPALKDEGITSLLYKGIPHIYHRYPAEEDLYALWRLGARLCCRNLATVIDVANPMRSSRLGKRAVKRRDAAGISVRQTEDAGEFWQIIVDDRRVRHNTTPVHTLAEMQSLRDKFPGEILFFVAEAAGEILAGAVVYKAGGVLHLQYAAATGLGKELYAVDVIYNNLIFDRLKDARWFDFGTSNEDAGRYLNEGMVRHKEEFGGRSIVYDQYLLEL
ncbi:MAG: GNAT family N-acetyltransferase [Muribaculaceae bacterium]|nr:GNAT family N-acetyltransferase [Muribaculaceae bacterium]